MKPAPFALAARYLKSRFFVGSLTLAIGAGTLAAQESPGHLLVTNKGDRTLSIVDGKTHQQVAALPENGITGHEVAASADGKLAFVPIFGNSGVGKPGTDGHIIQVFDIAKKEIIHSIDFGRGVRPHHPVTCPKSGLVYVTTELENSVSIIDPKTFAILGAIDTGRPESHMLIVSNDGTRGYTANVGSGTVSVLDLKERKLLKVIEVGPRVQRIAISNDDKWVFTADQIHFRLAVIETATNEVKSWIELPDYGYGMAPTPDGKKLLVTIINRNLLAEIDLATQKVTRTVPVPKAPQAVLVRPDGAFAYVSCDASGQVAVINLKEWKVETLVNTGKVADGMAWAK